MCDEESITGRSGYEEEYDSYKISVDHNPESDWLRGDTLNSKWSGYLFSALLKSIIDANHSACTATYLPRYGSRYFPLSVVPEVLENKVIGAVSLNGFLSNLIPGLYQLKIELVNQLYVSFSIKLESSEPMATWTRVQTLPTGLVTYLFASPLMVIIDGNTDGCKADSAMYERLAVVFSVVGATERPHSLPTNGSHPFLGVVPEEEQGSWVGTSMIQGFSTNLPAGEYRFHIEVLDLDIVDTAETAEVVVANHLSESSQIL
uniref:Uncharacterized protein n=1 Tax=Kwoniella dejecticola CBS 10117 TaxID=1296121 RepID=A0A1A6AEK9_9TREE|nr:uncharacterized protein I303_00317 [Kwoniella dejecticola CBS 10117]OBR88500.1 hypothetical protein I303_00317 [Kwoniella dejecticola CBS 10117]